MLDSGILQNPYKELEQSNPALAASYIKIWDQVLEHLRGELTEVTINTWLKEIRLVSNNDNTAVLFIENKFQRDVVSSRYQMQIQKSLSFVLNKPIELYIMKEKERIFEVLPSPPTAPSLDQNGAEIPKNAFDYDYTFETFIVGNSNRFAHAASIAVANSPANSYNPLFIYGGSGLGKTHLLYAIMNHMKRTNPDFNVVYIKGDEFTNELIQAIQHGKNIEFRSKYRFADMLLVDDIQFIAGKEMSQEEFFHSFNTLYEARKQIIMTSDRPPKDISTLEERLRTRFEWGLLADIQPPDFETRVAIIQRKANMIGIDLSEDVITFVANNIKTNIRQLEGAVKKLKAFEQLTGTKIDLAIAQNAVKDMFTELEVRVVTAEQVINTVAKYYNLLSTDLVGKKRTNEIVVPRQIAMYIIRELTDLSLPAVGEKFGGRDHTTVLYAVRQVEKEMAKNYKTKQIVFDLIKNIQER